MITLCLYPIRLGTHTVAGDATASDPSRRRPARGPGARLLVEQEDGPVDGLILT